MQEEFLVVPPSHLLREQGCALTGGAFLKAMNAFFHEYYEGRVVMGSIKDSTSVIWEDSGVDRSPLKFFTDYPPIIRDEPRTIFKERKPIKR